MPPVPATEQLRRLLVMIPWLSARGRVSLDEVARAFHISTKQAEADVNQAMMIGVPPYTGGCYVNVYLDADGDVVADPGPYLSHPPKLTPAQGFALLASARAVLDAADAGLEPHGPLASAVAKLEKTLGDTHVVGVDLQAPPNLDVVRDAVETGTSLRIEYYAAWRDDVTDRVIDPHVVFQRNGRWYVQAWCHRANDIRRFRIDRIRSIEPVGSFTPVRAEPPTDVWDPGADAPRVVIDIPATERWVVEAYPVEWEERGDMLRVTMNVLGTAWLERLLLKVGPSAKVIEPESMRSVGADAARRLLEAY
jgi:proteasome accessory factor C